MSNYGPSSAFLLVGGRNISGDTFTLDETVENVLESVHGLGESWEESLPVGISRVLLEAAGGIYDDRVGGIMEALQAKSGTLQNVSYGHAGMSVGTMSTEINGTYAAIWKRISGRDALTHAHAVHKISGKYYRGRILHALTAETTASGNGTTVDWSAEPTLLRHPITSSSVNNPTVITCPTAHGLTSGEIVLITGHSGSTPSINGGNGYAVTVTGTTTFTISVNVTVGGTGGYFQKVSSPASTGNLHVTALTLGGYTSVTIKIQHSIDNSAWVDLHTFSNVTAVNTGEAKESTTQVNRWRRMTWAFNGSGSGMSITPYVGIGG